MSKRAIFAYAALVIVGVSFLFTLFVILPRFSTPPAGVVARQPVSTETGTRKITAHLFYVMEDGLHLASVDREVEYGEGTAEQARHIIEAQLAPAPAPYGSPIPDGTKVRTVFVSGQGEAFVDLSREIITGHSGGSLNELFTVYTIVDALTANLPAITAVQLLVDGREVDTLAGHVDLRRPLQENTRWVVYGNKTEN